MRGDFFHDLLEHCAFASIPSVQEGVSRAAKSFQSTVWLLPLPGPTPPSSSEPGGPYGGGFGRNETEAWPASPQRDRETACTRSCTRLM